MIKLLVLDVDGTLTDSRIYYSDKGIETKAFSTKDGAILKCFPKLGIHVVFLTGRACEATERRARDLGARAIQGVTKKGVVIEKLFTEYDVKSDEVAYIGDDLNDFNAMSLCGIKCCPSDAAEEIKQICDYIAEHNGGHGAVRECCEYILKRDNKFQNFLDFWMI
jgi:3-deoxy-D-manno-octulosonate 8-phosphate phosphatase (KDO 8-P phosphatase)